MDSRSNLCTIGFRLIKRRLYFYLGNAGALISKIQNLQFSRRTWEILMALNPFLKINESRRQPYGLEWVVFKKLPLAFLVGTMMIAVLILLLQLDVFSLDEKRSLRIQYALLGLMFFQWIVILGLGFFCFIVMTMKGPAYVMDPYPLSDSDNPRP
jgi:hypothetical protein